MIEKDKDRIENIEKTDRRLDSRRRKLKLKPKKKRRRVRHEMKMREERKVDFFSPRHINRKLDY